MKTKFYFFIYLGLIISAVNVKGQISSSFNPKPGNQYYVTTYTNLNPNTGNAGKNQVYNFESLPSKASDNTLTYGSEANNPNTQEFPNCNVYSEDKDYNTIYFRSSGSDLKTLGYSINFEGSFGEMILSNTKDIKYPLNYAQLQIDDFVGFESVLSSGLPVKIYRTGKDSVLLDGEGTLKLDGKTKQVNRVKIISNYTDSIKYISDLKRKNIVKSVQYLYIGVNEDFPTVIIEKTITNKIIIASTTMEETNIVKVLRKENLNNIDIVESKIFSKVYLNGDGDLIIEHPLGSKINLYTVDSKSNISIDSSITGKITVINKESLPIDNGLMLVQIISSENQVYNYKIRL